MHATDLIADYRLYTRHFNRTEYPAFFRRYQEAASPFFESLQLLDIPAEVTALLDELETAWASHRWKFLRETAREEDKQLLLLYLAPAAMEQETETAAAFAGELARQWNERFPESLFRVGRFAELQAGFRWTLKLPGTEEK